LDKLWKVKKVEERMEARLIRYADDRAPRGCTCATRSYER